MTGRRIGLYTLLAIAAVYWFAIASNPLRSSDDGLAAWMLEVVPLGTDYDSAILEIENKGWVFYEKRDSGYCRGSCSSKEIVGAMSIRAELGSYFGFPFRTYVTAFLAFDQTEELIDIWIWKTVDGL